MHLDPIDQPYQAEQGHHAILTKHHRFRLIASGLLAAAALLISLAQTPLTEEIARQMRGTVSLDVNVDESLGKTKFIERFFPGVQAVLNPGISDQISILQDYVQTEKRGIVLDYAPGSAVRSFCEGKIIQSGEGEVSVLLQDGTTIDYEGCSDTPLSVGVDVDEEDVIAAAGEQGIRVTVWRFGVQTDPEVFLDRLKQEE